MVFEVGRLCIKTAGRDAAKHAVIVEVVDDRLVLIDGNVRRKTVNKLHLEPLSKTIDIKKGADTKTVLEAFEKEGLPVEKSAETKPKKEKKAQVKKDTTKKKTEDKK